MVKLNGWSPLYFETHLLGHYKTELPYFVFFGNRFFCTEKHGFLFKKENIFYVEQVHGTKCIEIDKTNRNSFLEKPILKGDALFTKESDAFLSIRTADCIPLLLYSKEGVAALHAGWRGLAHGIVKKTVKKYFKKPDQVKALIGPHIRKASFEVHKSVSREIALSVDGLFSEFVHPHKDPEKDYVDLSAVLKKQLILLGLKTESIEDTEIDTFSDLEYPSYRRDYGTNQRMYSLIGKVSSIPVEIKNLIRSRNVKT